MHSLNMLNFHLASPVRCLLCISIHILYMQTLSQTHFPSAFSGFTTDCVVLHLKEDPRWSPNTHRTPSTQLQFSYLASTRITSCLPYISGLTEMVLMSAHQPSAPRIWALHVTHERKTHIPTRENKQLLWQMWNMFYCFQHLLSVWICSPIIYLSPVCSFVSFGKSSLSILSHETINMHATQHSLILILLCKWLNIAIFWLSFFFLLVNLDSLWNDFHTFTPHISLRPSSKPTGFFKHLFCTSSFLHTLRLSANPLFITTWSYRVFTPLIINFVRVSSFVCSRCLLGGSVLFFDSVCSLPRLFQSVYWSVYFHICVCVLAQQASQYYFFVWAVSSLTGSSHLCFISDAIRL